MNVKSFRQFISWYLKSLTDNEIAAAVETLSNSEIERSEGSVEEMRNVLQTLWEHKKYGAIVGEYFSKQHQDIMKIVSQKSRDELRAEVENLVQKYGIKPVAFALIVGQDKYTNEIGYELINNYEKENMKALKSHPAVQTNDEYSNNDITVERALEDAIRRALGEFDTGLLLDMVINQIKKGSLNVNMDVIDDKIQNLLNAWNECKQTYLLKEKLLSEISKSILHLSSELKDIFQYLYPGELCIPLDIEKYHYFTPEKLSEIKTLLEDICDCSQEALEWRSKKLLTLEEDRERFNNLERLQQQVKDRVKMIKDIIDYDIEKAADTESEEEKDALGALEQETEKKRVQQDAESDENQDEKLTTKEQGDDVQATPEINEDVDIVTEEQLSQDENEIGEEREEQGEVDLEVDKTKERTLTDFQPNKVIWEAIAKGDVSTAYWLAREIEDKLVDGGLVPETVPSWLLLAAVLGMEAEWKDSENKDLFYSICKDNPKPVEKYHARLGLSERDMALFITAIALQPALMAPETGAETWLREASLHVKNPTDPLRKLLEVVLDFLSYGKALDRKLLRQTIFETNWEKKAKEVSGQFAEWLKRVQASRILYAPANEALKYLFGPDSRLNLAITAVRENDFKQIGRAKQAIKDLLYDRKAMVNLIQEAASATRGSRPRVPKIVGSPLDKIVRTLNELKNYLQEWVEVISIGDVQRPDNKWWYQKTLSMQEEFIKQWSRFQIELDSIEKNGASVHPRHSAVKKFARHVFQNFVDNVLTVYEEAADGSFEQKLDTGFSAWKYSLRRPLLMLKDAPIDDNGDIDLSVPFRPQDSLYQAIEERRDLEQLFWHHLESEDFLLAELILEEFDRQGIDIEKLEKRLGTKILEAQYSLKEKLEAVRNKVEQATIDHVLSEEQRSVFDGELLSIEEQDSKRPFILRKKLIDIEKQLAELRQQRQESLKNSIDQVIAELKQRAEGAILGVAVEYIEKAREALNNGDLPLADEYLHYSEQAINTGIAVDIEQEVLEENPVEEFCNIMSELHQVLESDRQFKKANNVVKALSKGKPVAGLNMKRVPGARYEEIEQGLEAWLILKRLGKDPSVSKTTQKALVQVLEYMGFQKPEVVQARKEKQSAHFIVKMSAGNVSPLADFGSLRNNTYDVVLFHWRPNASTMGQILHEYGVTSKCPIIVFLGRMTDRQRGEWSEYCKKNGLTAMLVDELLLYYLASQRESRLPAAVSCGVAWGYAIPYRSFGIIPPEIFKGRRDMVQSLGRSDGSCIAYGGRQFGKSALLHMVKWQFHNPEQGTYVIYDDIKPLGDPQGYRQKSEIWNRLRERLVSLKLLDGRVGTTPGNLALRIIERLNQDPSLRIVVLFDEADNFLAADAKSDFEEVAQLRNIMDQTNRRFKVVFCGLHSVQRYMSQPNHPFAQLMAQPLIVGPLDPKSARSLIIEPMLAIGFTFSSKEAEEAVLRILCYTNYHPALIQHFCSELIKLVWSRQYEPPYKITVSDVEAVYRRKDVRGFMNERFNWTLDLDSRYAAMVYAMVMEQIYDRDGFRREFTASEVLEIAQSWWHKGFADVRLEDIKSLLEELIGLGVLIRRPEGTFRLRNGNVVRALGSEQEIYERLIQVTASAPPAKYDDASQFRFNIDPKNGIRSPLTVKQAGALTKLQSGVGLIFGSRALGVDEVPSNLKLLIESGSCEENQLHTCRELSPEYVTSEQILKYLRSLANGSRAGRILEYTFAEDLTLKGVSVSEFVGSACTVLSRPNRRGRIVRLAVLFTPGSIQSWFLENDNCWNEIEDRVDVTVNLKRWDGIMVQRFLSDLEIPCTQRIANSIIEATGGWPWLLRKLWRIMGIGRKRRVINPTDAVELLKDELEDNKENICVDFVSALGIEDVTCGKELLALVKDMKPIKWEEIEDAVEVSDLDELNKLSTNEIFASLRTLERIGIIDETENGLVVEPVAAEVVAKVDSIRSN
ncbi:hypothetical protein [Calderihabitans maritimus]|uniref:Uncharacterized protein n=1 Tax=Calderihabitans maritimus TaxID=1246530 RepID=A0A1Z5HXV8_9FIRM|nr:hypothetical protein [Calderihabitans maritimus]GAW94363.1 hypothetical protein Sfum_0786 [Calderihabitans maritimus]